MLEHIPQAVAEIVSKNAPNLFSNIVEPDEYQKQLIEFTDKLTRTITKAMIETTKRVR